MKLLAGAVPAACASSLLSEVAVQAMNQENSVKSAELIIVPPQGSPEVSNDFAGRCTNAAVDFYFEPGDRLPTRVPAALTGVKAIVIEDDEVPANAQSIAQYESTGAQVYRMGRDRSAAIPNATLAWGGELTFQTICFDAGLTLDHPAFREKRLARNDDTLLNDLGEAVLRSENVMWYDAPRYQWECMVDCFEVTGERRYLDTAQRQILNAMDNVPNDLSNCDTVAGLIPALRLYEHTRNEKLLSYAIAKFDEYVKITPKCEGSWVNFLAYRNNVRSEILWQVLPGLMLLAKVAGNKKYSDIALEQFEIQHRLLFNKDQSLWSHGYANGRRTAGFWGRGVAFGFLGNLMVLELLDKNDRRFETCLQAFVNGAKRLRELQDESGYWLCVPERAGSGKESSGTAWTCTALDRGIRLGFLDKSYRACADLAWDAVKCRIWQGRFPGHMFGTTASLSPEYYLKKGISETGWAHFALRAVCEHKRAAKTARG